MRTYKIKALGIEVTAEDIGELNYKEVSSKLYELNDKEPNDTSWRLPTINELKYLHRLARVNTLNNGNTILDFDFSEGVRYWSSSNVYDSTGFSGCKIIRNINSGVLSAPPKDDIMRHSIRLVRDI